jgi:hypothetical protein
MKKPYTTLLLITGLALVARAAEPTIESLQKDLNLTKAQLKVAQAEIAETKAKQALAAAKAALKKIDPTVKDDPDAEVTPDGTEEPATVTPKPNEPRTNSPAPGTRTQEAVAKLPAFSWRQVDKKGTDLFTHTGTRMIAPYKIDTTTRKLTTDGGRLGGFLELVYSNTWAWQPDSVAASLATGEQWKGDWTDNKLNGDSAGSWVNPFRSDWDRTADFSARMSFEFANGGTASVGTVTGSGDFGAEVAGNKHILQGYGDNSVWSLGVGGSVGGVTDRNARQVHPRFFGGLVANIGRVIEVDSDKTKRMALLHLGLGFARIDNVVFDPTDPTKGTILFDGAAPLYRRKTGPAAEAELFFPVSKAAYATVGARFYGQMDPSPWSLSLGMTVDLVGAIKGIVPSSNTSEAAAAKTK